jgi:hypothetical protein
MECLKACPHSSIEFRLRMPGADLWNANHKPMAAESALMFMLLGAVALHHMPLLLTSLGLDPGSAEDLVGNRGTHIAASIAVLAAPGALAWGADVAWRVVAGAAAAAAPPQQQQPTMPPPAMAAAGGGEASAAEARAVALLQRAAAGYQAQESGALVVAPIKPFLDLGYG